MDGFARHTKTKSASEIEFTGALNSRNFLPRLTSAMAAVGSSTAAEATSAVVESATAVKAVASSEAAARKAAAIGGAGTANKSTIIARPSVISAAIVAATSVVGSTVVAAAIISPGPTVVAAPVIAVEPRAGTDEDAVHKPVRAVVSIRGAGIRVIIIVTVVANGTGAVIDRATNADGDTNLGVCAAGKSEKQQSEQSDVLEISHFVTCAGQHRSSRGPVSFPAVRLGKRPTVS